MATGSDRPVTNGRTAEGRFAVGNAGGTGNPLAKRMYRMRAELLAAVAPETIRAAAQKLGEQAAEGDIAAMKLLFEYVVGRPPQAIELTVVPPTNLSEVYAAIMGPWRSSRRPASRWPCT